MPLSNERLRILQWVEDGKVSPEEGIRLIQALEEGDAQTRLPPHGPSREPSRWLRVQITHTTSGKVRLNVRLPVTVLNTGMKISARFSDEIGQIEMGKIFDAIEGGVTGQVIDVFAEQGEKRVQVFLE